MSAEENNKNEAQGAEAATGCAHRPPLADNYLVAEQLQKMPSILARGLLYSVLGMIAAGIAYCTFTQVDLVVECPAVVAVRHNLAITSAQRAEMRVDILIRNKDVGFVVAGMPVQYKLDAFPYFDCGTFSGIITDVAEAGIEQPGEGFVFQARGSIDRTHVERDGRRYQVKPGMTGVAQLVKGRRSIISVLFSRK